TRRPVSLSPSNACGLETSWTRCRSTYRTSVPSELRPTTWRSHNFVARVLPISSSLHRYRTRVRGGAACPTCGEPERERGGDPEHRPRPPGGVEAHVLHGESERQRTQASAQVPGSAQLPGDRARLRTGQAHHREPEHAVEPPQRRSTDDRPDPEEHRDPR